MKILIVMVGLPGSGKSTVARDLGVPMVNPDSVRLCLHGQRYAQPAERFVWPMVHLMVESLFQAGHHVVLLDATNATRKRRAEWLSRPWHTVYLVMDTTETTCRQRYEGDQEMQEVITRMASAWEAPQPEEGGSVVYYQEGLSLGDILRQVLRQGPEHPVSV